MNQADTDVHDPLSRAAFESIVYNAVGRASEINTYPAYALSHSTGNSGWSTGIVQWDFGQPGRGHKVAELLERYQAWAELPERFDDAELQSLSARLQRRGQTGNALDTQEQARLNSYLRSGEGRVFVESLNREQLDAKWRAIGGPLAEIQWLRDLRDSEPAQVTEIVAMASKLFNQNEVRGRRLRDHLEQTVLDSQKVREWIGGTGIEGLNPAARRAIVSGRDKALEGARLLIALEAGTSPLSERWKDIGQDGNSSLARGFDDDPDLQLFDAMLRHPGNGSRLLQQVEGIGAPAAFSIRGVNALARIEMAEVRADANGGIALTTTQNAEFALRNAVWTRSDHPLASELRARIRALYQEHDHLISDAQLERTTAHVFSDVQRSGAAGKIGSIAFGVDHRTGLPDPAGTLITWLGDPRDPATKWCATPLRCSEPQSLPEVWRDIDRTPHQRIQHGIHDTGQLEARAPERPAAPPMT